MENKRKTSKSTRFWDKLAPKFDNYEKKDQETYSLLIEKTRKYLEKDQTVLDFGCGTGLVSNEIAQDAGQVTAIDISSKMIELAKAKASSRGIQNIAFLQAGIDDGTLTEKTFDVVIAAYILHLLDDLDSTLARIHCLLKPGGLFITTTPCLGDAAMIRFMLSLAALTGLVPKTKAFTVQKLEKAISGKGFALVQSLCLNPNGTQQFIVAKKNP